MPDPINQTNITPPRVPLTDERTGLISREWYRFFLNLFKLTGSGTNDTSLVDLQLGPVVQDNVGELIDVYDQAQIASMMAQFEAAQSDFDLKPRDELGTLAAENADNVRLIGFSTSPSPAVPNPAPTGTVYWDGGTTLGVQMTQNVVQKVGEDQYFYIKATATITKGQLIMFTGSVGASGQLTGSPATGLTDGQYLMGVAAENIALNAFGLVNSFGLVRGINASGSPYGEVWADGDILYYNPAYPGGLTNTQPTAPNIKSTVAVVVHDGSGGSGSVFVRISVGSVLGGTDSNVQFTPLSNGDLIQYNSGLGYWQNIAPSTISIGTATNLAGGAAGSVPYQTGAGATSMLALGTAAQVLQVNAGATAPEWVSSTGTGNVARATSPTFVTPTLGAASATSIGLGATAARPIDVVGDTADAIAVRVRGRSADNIGTLEFTSNDGATQYGYIQNRAGAETRIVSVGASFASIYTNSSERIRVDSAGRLGLGVTPNTSWDTALKVFETAGGAIYSNASGISVAQNAYYDGASWRYSTTAAATKYGTASGAYQWFIAGSGSAGTAITFTQAALLDASGNFLLTGAGSLGYGTGSGGTVTQITSRTTGVTINKSNGAITLFSAAGSAAYQSFTVTNSKVAATDTVVVSQKSGTDLYIMSVTAVAAGSFRITYATTGGTTVEQPVFNFAVIKAVTA